MSNNTPNIRDNASKKFNKSGFSHQDWSPVTFNKPASQMTKSEAQRKGLLASVKKNTGDAAMFKLDNATEIQKTRCIDKAVSKMILDARLANKLTQKDLAGKANVTVPIIASFENGKALSNNANDKILNKIKKILKISNQKK